MLLRYSRFLRAGTICSSQPTPDPDPDGILLVILGPACASDIVAELPKSDALKREIVGARSSPNLGVEQPVLLWRPILS